ncbi:hypothetical protein Q9Q99_06470 [Curtobacterium flaccumfaciens]|nr:hypothetical protein Q9Q99_06470 [Curtobacterium flaccumfaciens]
MSLHARVGDALLDDALRRHVHDLFPDDDRLSIESTGTPAALPNWQAEEALTILLEALTNRSKHAPGSTTSVRFAWSPAAVVVTVADDGPGFDVQGDAGGRLGQQTMREARRGDRRSARRRELPGHRHHRPPDDPEGHPVTVTHVAIVDDHRLFREGLATILAAVPTIRVVAHGERPSDVLASPEAAAIDVLLLDVEARRPAGAHHDRHGPPHTPGHPRGGAHDAP